MAKQIPVDDFGATLADEIIKLSRSLKGTKLSEDAIVILLAEASKVPRLSVRAVIQALPSLERKYTNGSQT